MEINGFMLPIELEELIVSSALSSRVGEASVLSSLRLVCSRWNTMACSSVKSLKIKAQLFSVSSFPTAPFRSCEQLQLVGKMSEAASEWHQIFPKIRVLDATSAILTDETLAALSRGLARSVELFRLTGAGISPRTWSDSISFMKGLLHLELSPEGLPLCSTALLARRLKSLRIVSFVSPNTFSITIDDTAIQAYSTVSEQTTVTVSIRAEFSTSGQLSLSAASDFIPNEHECRFFAGSSHSKPKSIVLWTGCHADMRVRLSCHSSLPLLSRIFGWTAVLTEFSSFTHIRDFFNVEFDGATGFQRRVVGEA